MPVVPFIRQVKAVKPNKRESPTMLDIGGLINGVPTELDIDYSSVHQLVDERSAANGDKNDAIVSTGAAEVALRKLIAQYGFDRMPVTLGELNGLLDYCNFMEGATGETLKPGKSKDCWQACALKVCAVRDPLMLPALKLYLASNLDGLRKFHKNADTLTRLGTEYSEYDE